MSTKVSIIDRFWEKVDKTPGLGFSKEFPNCWEFKNKLSLSGYGLFYFITTKGNKIRRAHRASYWLLVEPFDLSLNVCHHCDNRKCVRPDHLFLGTHKDNMKDMINKNRGAFGARNGSTKHPESKPRGINHHHAVFKEEDIYMIRALRSVGVFELSQIAVKFGCSTGAISHILKGRSWKHLI